MTELSHTVPSRVEFYLHDWNDNPTDYSVVALSNAEGIQAYLVRNAGKANLLIGDLFAVAPYTPFNGNCSGFLGNLPTQAVYARYMHNPTTKTDTCEMWDSNGIRFHNSSWTYTSDKGSLGDGVKVGDIAGENRSIGFFRIYSDLVPLNSRMPVTADSSPTRLLEWKFDGNLNDSGSGGNRWPATMSSGSPTYVATPYQNVIAVLKTAGAPSWTNWTSLRAGFPGQLDGANSFSQSDSSAAVTCFWQELSGPSTLSWSNHTDCMPAVTGLVFGSYQFQLVATDASGQTSAQTQDIGAVATDDNGVVVNADPNTDLIYGPMIAFGKNPWQFQDERAIQATKNRSAYYSAHNLDSNDPDNAPSWAVALPGTISWPIVPQATTLCGPVVDATVLSITVCTVEKLDLSTFPTHVMLGGYGGEEVVITGTTGTSGTQTLTVGYDGRGFRSGGLYQTVAKAWSNGAAVTQHKVTGSGTSFLTTFNPAGSGVQGKVTYNTGTVTATAGSAIITGGGGANWTYQALCGFDALCGLTMRVSGTHGGTPFVFFAFVNSVNSPTQVTVSRNFPSDADTASGLTYAFVFAPRDGSGRNMVLHYGRTDNVPYPYDGMTSYLTSGCETDSACFLFSYYDPLSFAPTTATCLGFTGMECDRHVSYMDGAGYVGDASGANYYDEGLAHMALYKRSGWRGALDAFHKIEGTDAGADPAKVGWMFYPENAQGDQAAHPRQSSVTGAVVAAVLDGKNSNWPAIRSFAKKGIFWLGDPLGLGCDNDLREGSAYPFSWLTLAALFDPDPAQRANWTTHLADAYALDNSCAGSGTPLRTNSHRASTFNTNQTPGLTATNGSAVIVSPSPINPQICPMIATGTDASVTNGSDVVTSPGLHFVNSPGKIMFFGDAVNPLLTFNFIYDNSGQIHLSGKYPGATATNVHWQVDRAMTSPTVTADAGMTIGVSGTDSQLDKNWACVLSNGGLTMTLDRPWDGPSGTVYAWHGAVGGITLAGRGTQPFVLGIKTFQMGYGALLPSDLGTNYNMLATNAATWIKTYGYDPVSGGLYIARGHGMCEPIYGDSSQPDNFPYGTRNPGCAFNGSNGSSQAKGAARATMAEAQNAARLSFQADSSDENRTFWDTVYNNQWGATGLTDPRFYTDGITTSNIDDSTYGIGGGKWPGFFFGVGMSHQWPAVRLGGVAPAINRNVAIAFNLAFVPHASKFQIVLTAPNGKITTVACPSSPCIVGSDARQGSHLMQLQYLDSNAKILAQSDQSITLKVK